VIKDSKFTKNLSPSYFSPACGMNSSTNTSDHEGDPNWTTVNYGDLEAWGNLHPSTSATKNVLGSSGIPGLAPTGRAGLQSNLLSSFAHQRYLESCGGMQHLSPYMVKREPGSQAGNQHSIGVSMNGGKTQESDHAYPPVPMRYDLMQRALIKTSHATTVVAQDNARSYTERATVATQDKARSYTEQASGGDFIPFVEGTYIWIAIAVFRWGVTLSHSSSSLPHIPASALHR
jgi:hypothetical protein